MKVSEKNSFLNRLVAAIVALMVTVFAYGQNVTVKADLDSSSIRVGEQTAIRLQAVKGAGVQLQMPIITDSLAEGLEVVSVSKPDTTDLKEGSVQINETIVVTGFDSAVVTIPPFVFVSGTDSFETQEMTLKVLPIEVDSVQQGLYDIKDVYAPPIDWWSVFRYVLVVLLIVVAIVGGYYLYKRYKQYKTQDVETEPEPVDAYDLAKKRLALIRTEKMWQTSDVKGYYTTLTDTLREYVVNRFGIDAMEMTSYDLIKSMKTDENAKQYVEDIESLDQIMRLSDLTKFAKWIPTIDEGKKALDDAETFVEKTREVLVAEKEKGGEA